MRVAVYRQGDKYSKRIHGIWSILHDFGKTVVLENDFGHLLVANKNPRERNTVVNYLEDYTPGMVEYLHEI